MTRKFYVWAEVRESSCVIEMPDDATDEECDAECVDALDSLIGGGDTGWNQVTDEEAERINETGKP